MQQFITIAQVVIAVLLIVLILMQQRDSDLSNFLGGGSGGSGFYQQRRGLERLFFALTIVCIVAFIGLALFRLTAKTVVTDSNTTPIEVASSTATVNLVPSSSSPAAKK